jgi:RNA polymerase sigma-70 factor (ECF subfamily)
MDLNKLPANDLAKLCCDAGNLAAWNEFVRRFQQPIALAVKRKARKWGGVSPEVVDDLVQDIFMRLCADRCKVLKNFVPKGPDSIIGYLVVVARNVAHDHFRAGMAQRAGGEARHLVTEDGDLDFIPAPPHRAHNADWSLRIGEIDSALKALMPEPVTERDYTIFWMYFQEGFTASEIGGIGSFRLSIKGVEASIHRTKELLRKTFSQE